jgi:hypothetical protein
VICCSFVFQPGTYDEEFHRLDDDIEQFARSLDGFDRIETWQSSDGTLVNAMYYFADMAAVRQLAGYATHLQAKSQVDRWYDGYRVIVSEVTASYGNDKLPA